MVLVDSCVWIEAAKAQGQVMVKLALRALLEEDEACFCGPVKLEIEAVGSLCLGTIFSSPVSPINTTFGCIQSIRIFKPSRMPVVLRCINPDTMADLLLSSCPLSIAQRGSYVG